MSNFIKNKYYKWYINIIDNAILKRRSKNNIDYFEKHHIIPKSLGGTNIKSNLVLLTAKEHYICHHLLYKFCDGDSRHKMANAWFRMHTDLRGDKQRYVNSYFYEIAKQKAAASISFHNKGINVGINSTLYDFEKYTFYNQQSEEYVRCTKWELYSVVDNTMTSPEVTRIIKNPTHQSKGWMLVTKENTKPRRINQSGYKNPCADNKKYIFTHSVFGDFKLTRYELTHKFPQCKFTIQGLTDLCCGRQRSHRGWTLNNNKRSKSDTTSFDYEEEYKCKI